MCSSECVWSAGAARGSDAARSLKVAALAKAIEAADTTLPTLLADAPDLNPIGIAHSKVKALMRKGSARPVDALTKFVGHRIKATTPDDCSGGFRRTGIEADPHQLELL
jgi:hypothetical protein